MKNLSFLTFSILFFSLNAQKLDYLWPLGYGSGDPTYPLGGVNIDFNFNPPFVYQIDRPMDFFQTVSSICDSSGNLLFYSNGNYIADKNGTKMPHGDTINNLVGDGQGYIVPQGMIIFPKPDTTNIYYIFHEQFDFFPPNKQTGYKTSLLYSIVDMTLNDSLGDIVRKNIVVIDSGLIESGYLTACKHANGKEWWIIMPNHVSNKYHRVLFTKEGVQPDSIQIIGDSIPLFAAHMSCFSPDGTKYVFYTSETDIYLYDFNRCTGKLSNFKHIPILNKCDSTFNCATGIAISPNSRYLYISSTFWVYQLDLWANDIEASTTIVGEFDWVQDTAGVYAPFYLAQLAPNGKIYIANSAATYFYHVINDPDSAGLKCNFVQRGLQLPTIAGYTIPHFPNYRLGAVSANYCDSLSTAVSPPILPKYGQLEIKVFPNPASRFLVLKCDESVSIQWKLFDSSGELVRNTQFSKRKEIALNGLATGVYWWSAESKFGNQSGKLIIK